MLWSSIFLKVYKKKYEAGPHVDRFVIKGSAHYVLLAMTLSMTVSSNNLQSLMTSYLLLQLHSYVVKTHRSMVYKPFSPMIPQLIAIFST